MKTKNPGSVTDSTKKSNVIEIEFAYKDLSQAKTRRKIAIPHGHFLPPLTLYDSHKNQWFLWDKELGIYQEVTGEILLNIEVP